MQLLYEVEGKFAFFSLLQETARFLRKDWPRDMEFSNIRPDGRGFTVRGQCPHCNHKAAFPTVTEPFQFNGVESLIAVARCIACNKFILAAIKLQQLSSSTCRWIYLLHYPVGKPDDTVSGAIPEGIRQDFQEALRCKSVDAFNATIELCRRALEASCIELGAKADLVLNDMIKWVHSQGKITTPLSDMAHKIKLGGNRAAHPSDRTLTAEDADAVLEFTKEYFQHVYVMPAKMAKFDFEKSEKKKP